MKKFFEIQMLTSIKTSEILTHFSYLRACSSKIQFQVYKATYLPEFKAIIYNLLKFLK